MKNAILIFLFMLLGSVYGQIYDLRIARVSDEQELRNFARATEQNPATGFSIAVTENEIDDMSEEAADYEGEFLIGEFVVICFSLLQDAHARIIDTTPNSVTHQLFPIGESNVNNMPAFLADFQRFYHLLDW